MLPLSILAPAIPGYTMMICRLTGTVVVADCGGAAVSDTPAAPTPADSGWQAASCCDTLQVTFQRAPAEVHAQASPLMASSLPVRWSLPPPITTAPTGVARGATAPPGLGPPRRLVTQTFLI